MGEENRKALVKGSTRSKPLSDRVNRMVDLVHALQEMNEREFTGYIKINFTQGGIGRIEKYEEILRGGQQAK
jgi:hypothetical protein